MLNVFRAFFTIPDLKKKILFTVAMILVFRFGAHVPVPGVDASKLAALFSKGSLVGFLDMFTGGALMRFSVFAMGIVPYINASIIMQLLTIVIPTLEQLSKEGEAGRKQISQYTRYLTVILAVLQSTGMAFWLRGVLHEGVNFPLFLLGTVVSLTAGAIIVMWLGELITERGIGNGASMIIFVGIVARIPSYIAQTVTLVKGGASLIGVAILISFLIFMVMAIVFIQEGQRKIPVQYAKRVVGRKMYGGGNTFIPM